MCKNWAASIWMYNLGSFLTHLQLVIESDVFFSAPLHLATRCDSWQDFDHLIFFLSISSTFQMTLELNNQICTQGADWVLMPIWEMFIFTLLLRFTFIDAERCRSSSCGPVQKKKKKKRCEKPSGRQDFLQIKTVRPTCWRLVDFGLAILVLLTFGWFIFFPSLIVIKSLIVVVQKKNTFNGEYI